MARSCTMSEVESFARAAVPGHNLVYFMADPVTGSLAARLNKGASPTLRAGVNKLRQLANDGMIDFVQKRVGRDLHYIAIWRERAAPKLPATYRFEACA